MPIFLLRSPSLDEVSFYIYIYIHAIEITFDELTGEELCFREEKLVESRDESAFRRAIRRLDLLFLILARDLNRDSVDMFVAKQDSSRDD